MGGSIPPALAAYWRQWRRARASLYRSLHDELTDLPNARLLRDRIEQALALACRDDAAVALLRIDLEQFRDVNDTVGRARGDVALQQVGARLAGMLRASDTVARLDGDEFAVVLGRVSDVAGAQVVAAKILRALDEPVDADGLAVAVKATVGVAVFPEHAANADELLARAEVALHVAKAERAGHDVYRPDDDPSTAERLAIATQLHRAVQDGELAVRYQPKADLRTGRVVAVEAMLVWDHPLHGLLPPDGFGRVAERTGLSGRLARRLLETALHDCHAWQRAGHAIGVAVTLGASEFHDLDLPDQVARLLHTAELSPQWLQVAASEASMMSDPLLTLEVVYKLRRIGVELGVSEFGTGCSSFAVLKRLPANELVIDRSFVAGLLDDEGDLAIVRSTVELAHNLRLRVGADGVDTTATWRELARLGCDLAVGPALARGMSRRELDDWLDANARVRARPVDRVDPAAW